jgi:hypothetical protein
VLEAQLSLLIHADPGARSGLVAAWLTDKLTNPEFDVGNSFNLNFVKIHHLADPTHIKFHNGLTLRIRPEIETIDLHSLLFLRKNVYTQIPNFTRNEYSLETFTKLTCFAKEIFEWDQALDYSMYDTVISFADTFDIDRMIHLYKTVNNNSPAQTMIDNLVGTNKLNDVSVDRNHACSILKLCYEQEKKLNLNEANRFWSIVDIYNTTAVDQLYNTVFYSIDPKNYGVYKNPTVKNIIQ